VAGTSGLFRAVRGVPVACPTHDAGSRPTPLIMCPGSPGWPRSTCYLRRYKLAIYYDSPDRLGRPTCHPIYLLPALEEVYGVPLGALQRNTEVD